MQSETREIDMADSEGEGRDGLMALHRARLA